MKESNRLTHREVSLPNIVDPRGALLFAEAGKQVPFDIARIFVLHSLADEATRGHHAHRDSHQFMVMLAGACDIIVDDGTMRCALRLERPDQGLYIPPMHWLELSAFTDGAVCAFLSSHHYDEGDYVRDRDEFEHLTRLL